MRRRLRLPPGVERLAAGPPLRLRFHREKTDREEQWPRMARFGFRLAIPDKQEQRAEGKMVP